MKILKRFYYSVFQFVSQKSSFRDMPFFGTTMVLSFLIILFVNALICYGTCLLVLNNTIIIPEQQKHERLYLYAFIGITIGCFYFFNKSKGGSIVEQFREESETAQRKRKREAIVIITVDFVLFIGAYLWRFLLA